MTISNIDVNPKLVRNADMGMFGTQKIKPTVLRPDMDRPRQRQA